MWDKMGLLNSRYYIAQTIHIECFDFHPFVTNWLGMFNMGDVWLFWNLNKYVWKYWLKGIILQKHFWQHEVIIKKTNKHFILFNVICVWIEKSAFLLRGTKHTLKYCIYCNILFNVIKLKVSLFIYDIKIVIRCSFPF